MIRLMIVDDHRVMRIGLVSILKLDAEIEVVAEAENGRQAIELFGRFLPDVTLLDIRMPDISGIDVLAKIRADHPEARIIMLTTSDMEEDIYHAVQSGAKGYLLKDAAPKEIIATIRAVADGRTVFPDSILKLIGPRSRQLDLSPRQIEVLELLIKGLTNKDIGLALGISYTSVKTHLESIYERLEVANRQEAISVAIQRGVVRQSGAGH